MNKKPYQIYLMRGDHVPYKLKSFKNEFDAFKGADQMLPFYESICSECKLKLIVKSYDERE